MSDAEKERKPEASSQKPEVRGFRILAFGYWLLASFER